MVGTPVLLLVLLVVSVVGSDTDLDLRDLSDILAIHSFDISLLSLCDNPNLHEGKIRFRFPYCVCVLSVES